MIGRRKAAHASSFSPSPAGDARPAAWERGPGGDGQRGYLLTLLALLFLAVPARAVDHNNIDAGRPLSFDDAEAVAYRERALEFGIGLHFPRGSSAGLGLTAEYLYGFALNSHLSVDFDPSIGGRTGSEDRRLDIGDVGIGVLHNFNREYGGTPALSLRGDVFLPTGRGSSNTEFRLRGILSKAARQYDRLHVNVDLGISSRPESGQRRFRPGVTLGYTVPLGYPTRFDRTGLAEISLQSAEESGKGPALSVGAGMRQQVTVRSVMDVGVQSDVAGFHGAEREALRVVAGYSTAF